MAQMPKDIQVTVHPVVDTEALDKLKATAAAVGAGFAQTAEAMQPAFDAFSAQVTAMQKQICQAFDVPPSAIGLSEVQLYAQAQQTDPWPPEEQVLPLPTPTAAAELKVLGTYLGVDIGPDSGTVITAWQDASKPGKPVHVEIEDTEGSLLIKTALSYDEIEKLIAESQKLTGGPLTVDQPWYSGMPVTEIEDDTGVSVTNGLKPSYHTMGLAMDFNVPSPHTEFPEISTGTTGLVFARNTANGAHCQITIIDDGVAEVVLAGPVPDGKGDTGVVKHMLTLPVLHAKQLCGLEPMSGHFQPPVLHFGGQPYIWAPETGWTAPKPVEPGLFAGEEPQPDGKKWAVPAIHEHAHLWCTACDVHWMSHKGDPVACESGGWLRPSTPLEDKNWLARQQMLAEAGLPPQ